MISYATWVCTFLDFRYLTILQRWKISCFRNEEPSPGASNPEFIDEVLHEELKKPEIDKPGVEKRNWISRLREVTKASSSIC